jgi:hypothetical protein
MSAMIDIRDWFAVNHWWYRERCRRWARLGPYQFKPGQLVVVTFGPSAGTVVRLERMFFAPPGSSACAIHALQSFGPIWAVSEWLEWDVERPAGLGIRRYRFMVAPWPALRAIRPRRLQPIRTEYSLGAELLGAATLAGPQAPGWQARHGGKPVT